MATLPLSGVNRMTPTLPRQTGGASQAFLSQAMKFMGQPYKWGGGHGPGTFGQPGPVDCSGLVTQAARMQGLQLGGTVRDLKKQGTPVSLDALKPGDLVFRGSKHVGIYAGNGQVLHAPKRGQPVQMTSLKGWDSARRPFDGQAAAAVPAAEKPQAGARTATQDQAQVAGGDRQSGVAAPADPKGGGAPAAPGSYTVQAGDSLSKIAKRLLGDANRWPEIHALNKNLIDNPDKIYPGQQLALPGAQPAEAAAPEQQGGTQPAETPAAATDTAVNTGKFGKLLDRLQQAGVTKAQLEALSQKHGVPLNMALAVIQQESGGNPNARSHAGATGLMQLMPGTAREMGVTNPRDPHQNLEGGFKYLGRQLKAFGGDVTKALAAYNAGPGNVRKHGGVPPFAETQQYVRNIRNMMAA